MKCLGRFKTQALTHCGVKIMSTRTAVGQFKGQFNGAMERYTWVRFAGNLTGCHNAHIAKVSIPVGRWNVTHGFDSRGTGGNVAEGSKGEHSAQKHILL